MGMSEVAAREMQRVIIVDLSNLRDERPGADRATRHHSETGEVQRYALANWEYLESLVGAIHYVAPHSAVMLIADESLGYHFPDDGQSYRRFFERGERHWSDPDSIYVMPSTKKLAKWRGDRDTRHGVQADELILQLAAELNGFVISGDKFSEMRYQELLDRFQHRTYSPQIEEDGQGGSVWRFVLRSDLVGRSHADRFRNLADLRQLDYDIGALPRLDEPQIAAVREEVFGPGGLVDLFWQRYGQRFGIPKTHHSPSRRTGRRRLFGVGTPPLTSKPFEVLKDLVGAATGGRGVPRNTGQEIERRFIFACDQHALKQAVDAHVTVLGRISDHAGSIRLCWYGGSDGIALSNLPAGVTRHDRGFVQVEGRICRVEGRIRKRLTRLELAVAKGSVVERVDFQRVVELLANEVPKWQSSPMRKWHFPRLPRRSDPVSRASRTPVATEPPPFDPRRPKIAPPGRTWVARSSAPQGPKAPIRPPSPATVHTLVEPPRRRPRPITVVLVALMLAAAAITGFWAFRYYSSAAPEIGSGAALGGVSLSA
jgi:hypothetical protein